MTNQDNQKRPLRVVFKRSTPLTKVALLAALVLSMVVLWTITAMTQDALAKAEALRQEAARLEQENNRLEQNIGNLGSVQGVQNTAQEELGLVNPDTVVIGSGKQD